MKMIMRNLPGFIITVVMFAGTAKADGQGTHVAGTIGAIGNNAVYSGGRGDDILIGGQTTYPPQTTQGQSLLLSVVNGILLLVVQG